MTASQSRLSRLCAAGTIALAIVTTTSCGQSAHPPPATGAQTTKAPAAVPAPAPTLAAVVPTGEFTPVSKLVNDAVAAHRLPGAVVQIGHGGNVVFRQAYGSRKLDGEPGLDGVPAPAEPMTEDTIFDLASLSKSIATTTAFMQLYERGQVNVDDPVQTYLPDFNPANDPRRAQVTVRMLLTHTSGIAGDLSLDGPWGLDKADKAEGIHRALGAWVVYEPGRLFHYSDINFILVGTIIERITGQPLDRYVQDNVFAPLGLSETHYLPATKACGPHQVRGNALAFDPNAPTVTDCPEGRWSTDLLPRIAPTALDEDTPDLNPDYGRPLRGTVHDPTARRMGGVAGSAGVFSTVNDVGRFAQALLDRRAGRPSTFPLKQSTVELMTTPQQPGHTAEQVEAANDADAQLGPHYPAIDGQDLRGFGWDIDTPHSRPRGALFPVGSFGHTGFTGVTLWMDPGSDTYVVVLANVIHQRGGPPITKLSGEVATETARALHLYGT
ncbi:beta-lactamase [Mycolicibacterium conceptionense]|uniref:Beta-lactamase n=2 Tax=Mycolicibacterium TaxID=1866885 RepID=A0ABR5FWW8_9MYCO|nr:MULTISPECIES: serine hydrolase domain-containing protein [Mycolicibacterium]KLI06931.1 beta-lactamase [Mycolicibacterium senegalense]KLO52450.1 beta-lactamase [Mycolicibacterium senegalense]KMV17815.1 beta-lactamase [Mycolicibacterium conceptionense]